VPGDSFSRRREAAGAQERTMSLLERLSEDMKAAMRAREKQRLTVVRSLLAALKKEAIDARGPLDEAAEVAVVQRAVKQRIEAAEAFAKGGRDESAAAERAEAEILRAYLPAQLSEEDLLAAVREIVERTGATGPRDVGKVMGPLMGRFQGQVDGTRARAAVLSVLEA
jgi:uncharacterized protein YqeY